MKQTWYSLAASGSLVMWALSIVALTFVVGVMSLADDLWIISVLFALYGMWSFPLLHWILHPAGLKPTINWSHPTDRPFTPAAEWPRARWGLLAGWVAVNSTFVFGAVLFAGEQTLFSQNLLQEASNPVFATFLLYIFYLVLYFGQWFILRNYTPMGSAWFWLSFTVFLLGSTAMQMMGLDLYAVLVGGALVAFVQLMLLRPLTRWFYLWGVLWFVQSALSFFLTSFAGLLTGGTITVAGAAVELALSALVGWGLVVILSPRRRREPYREDSAVTPEASSVSNDYVQPEAVQTAAAGSQSAPAQDVQAGRRWFSRRLYEWEIDEFYPLFGDTLDYSKVRIHENAAFTDLVDRLGRRLKGMPPASQGSHNAITLGNHCYFPVPLPDQLVSVRDPESYKLPWLAHELTHAWQYQQQGWLYLVRAILAQLRQRERAYDYGGEDGLRLARQSGRRFSNFNPEQQGNIVQNYYARMRSQGDVVAFKPFIDDLHGVDQPPESEYLA